MTSDTDILKIGTRGSPLALAQAHHVQNLIEKVSDNQITCEITVIKTSGDKFLNSDLKDLGGKGLFTKEIEEALQNKIIDIAVHSMKDVPTLRQKDLEIAAILKREDPRDAFISEKYNSFKSLPQNAHIGTASLRRTAQLKRLRPDLKISLLRGNIQTRLKKISDGYFDATLLAKAGLNRMAYKNIEKEVFSTDFFPPAPAQGAVGIETHKEISEDFRKILHQINCTETQIAVTAERAFLQELDGNCRTPLSAYAVLKDDKVHLFGQLLSEDGLYCASEHNHDSLKNAEILGQYLGQKVKTKFELLKANL